MPTGPEQRAAIDATFAAILPRIVERQEAYRAKHGRYWQGLSSAAPEARPPGVPANWHDVGFAAALGFDPALLPGPVSVDEYESAAGAGWVARMEAVFEDGVFLRAWEHGPAACFGHGWVPRRA